MDSLPVSPPGAESGDSAETTAGRTPGRTGPKPKGMGPERREEILAHALRLFGEHGVHTVSTRQIASAVGISQPSLYAYFPTRRALMEEVARRAFQALFDRMGAVIETGDDRNLMAQMARAYIDFGIAHPDAYRVAFMIEFEPEAEACVAQQAQAAGAGAYHLHRAALARVAGPGLDEAVIDCLAQSQWASLHGLVSLFIARPGFPWVDRERLIRAHIASLPLHPPRTERRS